MLKYDDDIKSTDQTGSESERYSAPLSSNALKIKYRAQTNVKITAPMVNILYTVVICFNDAPKIITRDDIPETKNSAAIVKRSTLGIFFSALVFTDAIIPSAISSAAPTPI